MSGILSVLMVNMIGGSSDPSQEVFTSNTTWTVPSGVRFISGVAVGGGGSGATDLSGSAEGGGGGGGGALSYSNDIAVTPGEELTIVVGKGGAAITTTDTNGIDGGDSYIARGGTNLLLAKGGGGGIRGDGNFGTGGSAASCVGDVKYSGGDGGLGGSSESGGGGGAAGYSGDGGSGTDSDATGTGNAGTGGGGGSGGNGNSNEPAGGGGGVGLLGEGTSGFAGTRDASDIGTGGGGGSGGSSGGTPSTVSSPAGDGGLYGGGGGGASDDGENSGAGGDGGIRIIWGGDRTYPNNALDYGDPNDPYIFDVSFLSTQQNLSSATQETFPSVSIGDSDTNRWIIITVHDGDGNTPTSVTVGGVTATAVVTNGTSFQTCHIYKAKVPNGTTADIVVNSGSSEKTVGLWRVITNATDCISDWAGYGEGGSNATVTIPTGGIAIATNCYDNATGNIDTGSQRFALDGGTTEWIYGVDTVTTGETGSTTFNGSGSDALSVVAIDPGT